MESLLDSLSHGSLAGCCLGKAKLFSGLKPPRESLRGGRHQHNLHVKHTPRTRIVILVVTQRGGGADRERGRETKRDRERERGRESVPTSGFKTKNKRLKL